MSELDGFLAQARDADPGDRINFRDQIAAHGEGAIDAMIDWLGDHRLAAFAIRVFERIGQQAPNRTAIVDTLAAVDRIELPPHLIGDLDRALASLGAGATPVRRRNPSTGASSPTRPSGIPGVQGRGYWVMRTSPWERPYLWSEAQNGRLHQGWGTAEDQNLEMIAAVLHRGGSLSDTQKEARRALRMLTSWEHGMRVGDVVIAPNLPEYGRLSVFRVTDSYEWSPAAPRRFGERFSHVLPVETLVADIDRWGPEVSAGLRAILGVQTRLYNITGYGGDVERLLGGEVSTEQQRASGATLGARRETLAHAGALEEHGDELLKAISREADSIGDRPLTMHWPTVGEAFDHGVLVVGQAVYGWMNSWTALDVRDRDTRARIMERARDPFPGLQNPMAWIDGHRVRSSPFWSVARQVTDAVAPGEAPWFSRLAWANLYPVAPNDVKSNPSGPLLEAQTTSAASFLDAAIREIQPRLVLVVGGPYVWPFVEPLGLEVLERTEKPLYLMGRRGGADWIVGMHPAGASRQRWGPARYAELIIATARSVSGGVP